MMTSTTMIKFPNLYFLVPKVCSPSQLLFFSLSISCALYILRKEATMLLITYVG